MEENSKPNRLHTLAFLEIGVFEIGFAAVILLLLFGILNYFNILSVSDAFPNQLGWLPRQETKLASQGQALQIPTPTNFTSAAFQYDVEKAKTLLTQYIKDTIKPEFLSDKIEIKQGLSIDGRTEDIKYEFGSMFATNGASFSANFHFKENENIPNDYIIFIQPPNLTVSIATVSLANSMLSSYFTNPYVISECKTAGNTSYCENFQILAEGKKGYGIAIFPGKGNIIFTCFVPKESNAYNTQKSCIRLQ